MGVIHVLPDLLVNRIAAGEVIERPASVVKELVENSLDAEASRVEIVVEEGGQRLIRVTDDGVGMDADDLRLSVVPHATSKIDDEQDLFAIGTMGFRGEALASIASVSQLRIVSRRRDADGAHEIRAAGNTVEGPRAIGAPVGTTVEIRDLFHNVPARRKFLRTAQTEFGHISEQVARLALAHPRVEFRLTHNGREAHRLPPVASLRERVADFYGAEIAESLIPVERSERGLRLTGLVAPPAQSRSTGRWEYAFVNGRFVRDRFIQHAVREAYRGLIDPQRHPVTFLLLQVEPSDVDVNVHPTKIEVRWRDSNAIHSLVLNALRDVFLGRDMTPALSTDGRSDDDAESRRRQIRQAMADYFKAHPSPPAEGAPLYADPNRARSADRNRSAVAGPSPDSRILAPRTADTAPSSSAPALGRAADDLALAADRVLQVHNTYLIAETTDGIVIVDQHALHERILYEQLSEQVSRGPLEAQRLLIPMTVDVPADQLSVLETHADLLHRLGLELTAFGHAAVAVHACPSLLRDSRIPGFVRDLFEKLAAGSMAASPEAALESLLQMMACKAAVKAGDPLTPQEIESLLALRHGVDRSSNCPHGRPTTLRLSVADLERQFKRA